MSDQAADTGTKQYTVGRVGESWPLPLTPKADGDLFAGGPFRVYLAGPMTGYPEYNRENFQRVATFLRLQGKEVTSPVELDAEEDVDYDKDPDDHAYDAAYASYLKRDILNYLQADVQGVVVLDGWEDSRGAALEVHVARELGLPVYDERGALVKRPTKYRPPTDETVAETASRLVGGDRQDQYGHPADDFARTAGIINAIYGTEFQARDIPVIMVAVKLSRMRQSPDKRDSVVDAVGYLLTYEMTQDRNGEPLR